MNMIVRLVTTVFIVMAALVLVSFAIVAIVRLTRVLIQFVAESLGYDASDFYFWVKRQLPKRKDK